MASILERLKALGIGTKSPEQQAREADPRLRAQFERRIPTAAEIRESVRLRRLGATAPAQPARRRPGDPVYGTSAGFPAVLGVSGAPEYYNGYSPAPAEVVQEEYGDFASGPGMLGTPETIIQAPDNTIADVETGAGTRRSTTPIERQDSTFNLGGLFTATDDDIRAGAAGLSDNGEYTGLGPEFGYTGEAAAGPNAISRGLDLLQERIARVESQDGIRQGAAGMGDTGEYAGEPEFGYSGDAAAGPNAISRGIDMLKERVQKEIDKYQENYMQRQQRRTLTKVQEMEQQVAEDIMRKEEARQAANDLAALDDEAGRLNAIMDTRNLLLRESGLFGQGRQGPSYTNPMQPVTPRAAPYDPGMPFYSNPDYYAAQSQSEYEAAMSRRPDIYNENNPFTNPEYYGMPQFKFVPNPRR